MLTDSHAGRLFWGLLPLAVLVTACSAEVEGTAPGSATGPNILLITIDALHKDRLEAYGYQGSSSPQILSFAKSAVVFEDAHTNTVQRLPAYASLMTGLPPMAHGCTTGRSILGPTYQTIAESLMIGGYDTAGVVTSEVLGQPHGLQQGITNFDEELALEAFVAVRASHSAEVSSRAIALLEAKVAASKAFPEERPWFLWLHYEDPRLAHVFHMPEGSEKTREELIRGMSEEDRYINEVQFTDLHVGRVLAAIDALGLGSRTLVALTGVHGEEPGEPGEEGESPSLRTVPTSIPLLIRVPGGTAGRATPLVRAIDLAPTLLDYAGVSMTEDMAGVSLRPLLESTSDWEPVRCLLEQGPSPLHDEVGILSARHKLVIDRSTGESQWFARDGQGERLLSPGAPDAVQLLEMKDAIAGLQMAASKIRNRQATGMDEEGREPFAIDEESSDSDSEEANAAGDQAPLVSAYADGSPWSTGAFVDHLPEGRWETWYANGKRKSLVVYVHGAQHGISLAWSPNGELRSRGFFKHGLPHGRWARWYAGKRRQSERWFAGGRPVGTWTYWYEDGQEAKVMEFSEGGRRVKQRDFFTSGNKRSLGEFFDGVREGVWRTWHPSGGLKRYWSYERGRANGPCHAYNADGFEIEGAGGMFVDGLRVNAAGR